MKFRLSLCVLIVMHVCSYASIDKKQRAMDDTVLLRHRNYTLDLLVRQYIRYLNYDFERANSILPPRFLQEQTKTYERIYHGMRHEREKSHRAGKRLMQKYVSYEESARDLVFSLLLQHHGLGESIFTKYSRNSCRNREA